MTGSNGFAWILYCGIEQMAAHRLHKPKVTGSSPVPVPRELWRLSYKNRQGRVVGTLSTVKTPMDVSPARNATQTIRLRFFLGNKDWGKRFRWHKTTNADIVQGRKDRKPLRTGGSPPDLSCRQVILGTRMHACFPPWKSAAKETRYNRSWSFLPATVSHK